MGTKQSKKAAMARIERGEVKGATVIKDAGEARHVKSSTAFFAKLQDDVRTQVCMGPRVCGQWMFSCGYCGCGNARRWGVWESWAEQCLCSFQHTTMFGPTSLEQFEVNEKAEGAGDVLSHGGFTWLIST